MSDGEPTTPPATTVSVSDAETVDKADKKSEKYTVYKVVVNKDGKTWFIFRRYNEFHKIHEILKKQFPEVPLKLPGKKLFGNFDRFFIEQRREGLHEFVQKLLTHPLINQMPVVREFLSLDNPRNNSDSGVEDNGGHESGGSASSGAPNSPEGSITGNPFDLGPSANPQGKPSDFQFLKVIGKGSFGKVLLAKRKSDGQHFAIKVLQKQQIMKRNEVKHIMAERNVLVQNVKHSFLVGLHYSFQTKDKLYFVLDYVNGGELFFHLQRERCFPEARARFYAAEIASALGYLHSLNIIYRDLKPENILLDSVGHIVLTDFGLCKENISANTTTSTFCGTPEYLAPEVLRKQEYDRSVDWWCLGAVLYEMVYGLPPFYSRDTAEMYDNILYKPLRLRTNISAAARTILEGLLQKDRKKRLGAGAGDVEDIKRHAFFTSIDWPQLVNKQIAAPYNPNVSGQLDLKHFDPEFVREPVPHSLGGSEASGGRISASVQEADNAFTGFSYVPPVEGFDVY